MTRIYAERDGDQYLIDARGHAEDAETCNYITGALYSFAGYVHNAKGANVIEYRTEKESGAMTIKCTGDALVGAAFEAAVIGLLQLQQARPEAVSVETCSVT